jgi:ABC-type lipoprotein export system ATPase subunit
MLKNVVKLPNGATAPKPPPHRVRSDKGHVVIAGASVTFGRGRQRHAAVERTSLEAKPGEFVCLLGPSGCGKSTLLNCVAGYVRPSEGTVTVDGVAVERPGPDRGMVFQQYSLFPWMTIRENVRFGPRVRGAASPDAIADTFLELVGLSRFASRYPGELSGGMQQRVGIARALANYPSVLLMDEHHRAVRHPRRRGGVVPGRSRADHECKPGQDHRRPGGAARAAALARRRHRRGIHRPQAPLPGENPGRKHPGVRAAESIARRPGTKAPYF